MCSLKNFKLVRNGILLSGNEDLHFVESHSASAWEGNIPVLRDLRHFFYGNAIFKVESVLVKEMYVYYIMLHFEPLVNFSGVTRTREIYGVRPGVSAEIVFTDAKAIILEETFEDQWEICSDDCS